MITKCYRCAGVRNGSLRLTYGFTLVHRGPSGGRSLEDMQMRGRLDFTILRMAGASRVPFCFRPAANPRIVTQGTFPASPCPLTAVSKESVRGRAAPSRTALAATLRTEVIVPLASGSIMPAATVPGPESALPPPLSLGSLGGSFEWPSREQKTAAKIANISL